MIDRRQFGMGTLASAALLAAGCNGSGKTGMKSISKVGIQTYTLRFLAEQDPLAMFKMIKSAGYDYVELNGQNFEQQSIADLKDMVDDTGLYAPSSHISLDALRGDLSPLLGIAKTFDMKYLIVPYIADNARSYDDWKSHAALMNAKGKDLASEGIQLAYHNHQFEFDDLGNGTNAMDIILGDCDPENLAMQIDLFWTFLADADIPKLFKGNPGRFKLCHIKDMGPNKADFANASYEKLNSELMLNVGEGIIPFEKYFALNDVSGMEYFIAEHDNPSKPYADAITTSLNAVRNFRF